MKRHFCSLAFALTLSSLSSLALAEDLAAVVNKANSLEDMSSGQLRKIILGQRSSWSSGKKVSVLLRAPGQPEREGVLRTLCGMSENDYNQFTMHADLNGETLAEPKVLGSGAAIRQSVVGNPAAIGFVRLSELNDTVKALTVDGIAAGKPGYKIKTAK